MRSSVWLALTGSFLLAAPVAAQGGSQSRGEKSEIPEGHKPPAGLCRIWLSGVPAAQQPAPTDCASAVRNRPGNGRVIFGEDRDKSRVPTRGFQPPATSREPASPRVRRGEEPSRPRGGEEERGKGSKKAKPEADPLA